jgi:hypothetical protein
MNGALPPGHLYALTAWAETTPLFSASSEQYVVKIHEHQIIVFLALNTIDIKISVNKCGARNGAFGLGTALHFGT